MTPRTSDFAALHHSFHRLYGMCMGPLSMTATERTTFVKGGTIRFSAWLSIIILLSGELSSDPSVSMVGHHHPSVWRVVQWFQRQHGWPSSSFCLESCPVVPASAWLAIIILLSGELSSGPSVSMVVHHHPSVWRVVQWSQRQHGWP